MKSWTALNINEFILFHACPLLHFSDKSDIPTPKTGIDRNCGMMDSDDMSEMSAIKTETDADEAQQMKIIVVKIETDVSEEQPRKTEMAVQAEPPVECWMEKCKQGQQRAVHSLFFTCMQIPTHTHHPESMTFCLLLAFGYHALQIGSRTKICETTQ